MLLPSIRIIIQIVVNGNTWGKCRIARTQLEIHQGLKQRHTGWLSCRPQGAGSSATFSLLFQPQTSELSPEPNCLQSSSHVIYQYPVVSDAMLMPRDKATCLHWSVTLSSSGCSLRSAHTMSSWPIVAENLKHDRYFPHCLSQILPHTGKWLSCRSLVAGSSDKSSCVRRALDRVVSTRPLDTLN